MKKNALISWFKIVFTLLPSLWLVGCMTSHNYAKSDRISDSVFAVRSDVVNLKYAVENSMKALDDLESAASTDPRKPYDNFAKSVDKVDDAEKTVKRHTDEMWQHGAAYFQEWQLQIDAVQNEEIREMAQERHTNMSETFYSIKAAGQGARQAYPPFLSDLRDLRTVLGADLTVQGIHAAKRAFGKTRSASVELQRQLDTLVLGLNSTAITVTAAKEPAK